MADGTDADLLERCRSGDVAAFEALYRAHAPRLYGVTCRLVGDMADAEDLLQEIFLLAHRKLGTFRGDAALGTWLYRLAINRCLDYLRTRAARPSTATLDATPDVISGRDARPTETIVARMDLDRAIAQLPDGYRTAFVLHDVEGLEHREIAALLGVSEGTSKSQVHKARLRLRQLLSARAPLCECADG